jgi:hypothetical protein
MGMKNVRQHLALTVKVCNCKQGRCNVHRTCEKLTSKETVEIPVTSTCLSVAYAESKTDRMQSKPLHVNLVEIYIRYMQVVLADSCARTDH